MSGYVGIFDTMEQFLKRQKTPEERERRELRYKYMEQKKKEDRLREKVARERRDMVRRQQEEDKRLLRAHESDYPGTFRTGGPHVAMVRDWDKGGYKIFCNIDGKSVSWFLSDEVLRNAGNELHVDIGRTMLMEMK